MPKEKLLKIAKITGIIVLFVLWFAIACRYGQ